MLLPAHVRKPLLSKKQKTLWVVTVLFLSCFSGVVQSIRDADMQPVFQRIRSDKPPVQRLASEAYASESGRKLSSHFQFQELAVGYKKVSPSSAHERPWGVSKQVSEHTWTIQVGEDARTATPKEIFDALNAYRRKHARENLTWDDGLAKYAESRAAYFVHLGTLDDHAGFMEYVNKNDGFHKLGFAGLGENSSYGFTLQGVHLIEWVYAGDKPHNDNQLSDEWTYVGIGTKETATNIIFGGKKL